VRMVVLARVSGLTRGATGLEPDRHVAESRMTPPAGAVHACTHPGHDLGGTAGEARSVCSRRCDLLVDRVPLAEELSNLLDLWVSHARIVPLVTAWSAAQLARTTTLKALLEELDCQDS
jgi:hypothetical protein